MNLFSFIDEIARKQVNKAFRQIKRGIVKDHDSNKVMALIPENQGQSKIPIEFLTDGDKGFLFIPKNGARIEIGEPQRKKLRKIIGIYPPDVDKDDHQAREVKDDEIVFFSDDNSISIIGKKNGNEIKIVTKNVEIDILETKINVTVQEGVTLESTQGGLNLTLQNDVSVTSNQGITLNASSDVTVVGSAGTYGVSAKLKELDDRVTALENS